VPAVCGRDVTMARRPKPAQIEPVVTSKCASGRPLLIDSALPIEFTATHSKQTTEKFLTGAITHISIFNFSPFTTQNPAQLIPMSAIAALPAEAEASDNRRRDRTSNRNRQKNRTRGKQMIKARLTETGITHIASRTHTSNRFWSKNRSNRKQKIKPPLTGSRIAHKDFSVTRFFSPAFSTPGFWPQSTAASALNASYSIGYNATHMPSGSQGTKRARITPPPPESPDSFEALPVHSRLPRLDLGVDWESPWQEFRSSVRDFFHGPRVTQGASGAQNEQLRVEWIEGKVPKRAFVASFLWHVAIVMILLLPIWGFLAHAEPTLTLPQIQLTYVPTQDLRPISLPGTQPKPSPVGDPAKPLPRSGADAFHPRQTILSQPLKITHPRQTLIQPSAPPAPPKIVPQMPNIAEWAATSPQPKPQLRISPTVVAPRVQRRAASDVAAPDVAAPERTAGPLTIAPSPLANTQPKLPVNPMSNSAPAQRNVHADAGAAPVIGPAASAGDESLHRLIAISATPGPPAPEVSVPQGNLSARVAISPEGTRAGVPGGSASGADGNGGSGGSAGSAGGAATNSGGNANGLPAGVSISGGNGHSGSAGPGTAGNRSKPLILKPMPSASAPPNVSRNEPIDISKIDPGLPPEKILSGKEVFTMRVDMPNLTSSSGSWILNFAQMDDYAPAYQRPKGKLAAPVPVRKVDPKYPQLAIKQHIDGEVILYAIIRKDGHVDSIQVVRSVDPELDHNAMEALSRWEFRPATREGQPVELEAVIHIPFHFNPPE
jgi:TonB family protein